VGTVKIIATGGTIANTDAGRISVGQVLDDIQRQHAGAMEASPAVSIDDILREGAETFTPHEWGVIAVAVGKAAADPGVDGIVVTHGTYTAEETAYFLHLTVRTDKPSARSASTRPSATMGTRTSSTPSGSRHPSTPVAAARCCC
jgi:glutamin-(asparagin-)ase